MAGLLGKSARREGATLAQVAPAWLLAQRLWLVPIPGTRKLARLEENIGATAVALTPNDLGAIERAAAPLTSLGARNTESQVRLTNR